MVGRAAGGGTLAAVLMLAATLAAALGAVPAAAAPAGFTIAAAGPSAPRGIASDAATHTYWVADAQGRQVYSIGADGAVVGTVPLPFSPVDVEALQVHAGYLYLGDIGDPSGSRSHITVYRLNSLAYGRSGSYHAWDFAYPDGPHDAAAMMVSPRGNIYVVTRGAAAAVYRAPATPSTSGVNTLVRVASAPSWVTDATFVTDSVLVLRTYTSVCVVNPFSWVTTATAELPAQPDGQGLTTALGSTTTLIALGGRQGDEVAVPTTLAPVSPAPSVPPGASAPASASPSASAPASAGGSDTTGGTVSSNRGTLTALGVALVVALLAGAVVAFKR